MTPTLSINIPVYNFAKFIPETLDSIVSQAESETVDIFVVDGASTDNTREVVEAYGARFANVKYVRLAQKGGIDRDMALAAAQGESDYVWLFSGDDIMRPGAIRRARAEIVSGRDLYLCKHNEFIVDRSEWILWPTVDASDGAVFELSDAASRRDYFSRAVNTEAFFSFIGGLIVKRATWNRVPLNEEFVGGCWAHAARMFELMKTGLSVQIVSEALLDRRPDNDSFAEGGMVKRFALAIDGYNKIADHFFGHDSFEAFHVRRVLRREFHPLAMQLGKFMCAIHPEKENRAMMDALLRKAYCDFSLESLRARLAYALTTPSRFRRQQPELCAMHERKLAERRGK